MERSRRTRGECQVAMVETGSLYVKGEREAQGQGASWKSGQLEEGHLSWVGTCGINEL